jgi:hypothetical protein
MKKRIVPDGIKGFFHIYKKNSRGYTPTPLVFNMPYNSVELVRSRVCRSKTTLITEFEKANAIASKFSLAHKNSDVFSDDSSSYTSPRDIKHIIKKLKNGKAPDYDGVPNIFLKNIPRKAYIYISCLKLGYFPKQ